jgi:hypothetical protein
MKAIIHSDRLVAVEEFPNKIFEKHWDDLNKIEYIIIENKKYYIYYPLRLSEVLEN